MSILCWYLQLLARIGSHSLLEFGVCSVSIIRINDVLINHRLRKTPNTHTHINIRTHFHCNPIYFSWLLFFGIFGRRYTIVSWLQLTLSTTNRAKRIRDRDRDRKDEAFVRESESCHSSFRVGVSWCIATCGKNSIKFNKQTTTNKETHKKNKKTKHDLFCYISQYWKQSSCSSRIRDIRINT